mgnify:FL=1
MRSRYGKVCPTIRSRFFLLLATFSVGFFTVSSAHAATYYVATTGSDSNPGSEAAAFRTIAHAVSRMNAGDTTYVKSGVYNEGLIKFRRSGTASAPIKLLNAPGESPVINFGANKANRLVHRIELNAGSETAIGWITIEGFELGYGYDGIKYYNAHDVTIRRNWIHHAKAQGILGSGKNMLIDRNVISHNGESAQLDHGMYLTGSNYVITNNLIYANATFGLQMAGYPWDMSQYFTGPNPRLTGHGGRVDPSYAGATGWLIANNTFAYNGAAGIVIWMSGAKNNRIVNNIFYENSVNGKSSRSVNGVAFVGGGVGNKIDNNVFYASGSGGTLMVSEGERATEGVHYTQSGNITVNPNFEGAGATLSGVPNFKLLPGSPAIDKGLNLLPQVTWDHAGGQRPFGAAFDIGAYEFGSPPDSGSPPPNPTGGGDGFIPGPPILRGPNGEVCPSGYL